MPTLLFSLFSRLLSADCLICRDTVKSQYNICHPCEQRLPRLKVVCEQCALPLTTALAYRCGACLREPPHFDKTFALTAYEPPVNHLISELKFFGRLPVSRALGTLLAKAVMTEWYLDDCLPDCIIPMPLHLSRLRKRLFNQAIDIGQFVKQETSIPLEKQILIRQKQTRPQLGLSAGARKKNMENAFKINGSLSYQHVALLDDVMTTGSTANEAARILKANGVERVDLWCCARA